mmetsp:Transcript_4479/g.12624  ORF Transcript_4479/g.12624 Transcript_4479/m.12624 type:complete len:97 (+) Transcript_4479:1591-1881(+)
MVLVWQSEGVLEITKARAVLSLHGNSLHADSRHCELLWVCSTAMSDSFSHELEELSVEYHTRLASCALHEGAELSSAKSVSIPSVAFWSSEGHFQK